MHILPEYLISHETLYIAQDYSCEAQTVIKETNATYYCKQSMTKILDKSCLSFGSSLIGRKKSVQNIFDLSHVPAFPISPSQDLYCFQTHSPRVETCTFIMTTHLVNFTVNGDKVTFYFRTGETKEVDIKKSKVQRIMYLLYMYSLYFKKSLPHTFLTK